MTDEASMARWATEPFIMGTPDQFRRLRDWLHRVQFTEPAICLLAGVESIGQLQGPDAGRTVFTAAVDAQSLLVRLFIDAERLPWDAVRSLLSADELTMLTDLGLLQSAVADSSKCAATIALIPSEGLHIASDRMSGLETIGAGLPRDLVYTPFTKQARRYVRLLPRVQCDDYLELCAGTGIAALLAASQFARRAWSLDITERCTRFARFNAALNDLENFSALQGDLYDPVAGKTFDVIVAHPPYVPAEETEMVFRDGGVDGEQITRRIVAGLADHLKPGGLFYLECMLTDRVAEPIEQRLRRMLGPAEDEFDVLVVRGGAANAKMHLADRLASGQITPSAFARQTELFKRLGIEQLVEGTTLIQRRATPRPVVTRHLTMGSLTRAEDIRWFLGYLSETVAWADDETQSLLDSRIRAFPETEYRATSVLRDGKWTETGNVIQTSAPFPSTSACPRWFPSLLARCNGDATVREHLGWLRAEGVVPETTSDAQFAQLIRELADVPYFELETFPLPARTPGKASPIG